MSHCININTVRVNPTMEVSVKKVKTDRIDIQSVYSAHATMDTDAFKDFCFNVIADSSGKNDTKIRTCHAIHFARSKAQVLKIVNNYWLAGQGLKV